MENGVGGYYECGWGQSLRACNEKEFVGKKGRITLQMNSQRSNDGEEGDLITVYHSDTGLYETVNVRAVYKEMYTQLSVLIDMIENNVPANPDIYDVWKAFRTAFYAEESIKKGCSIKIDL